MQHAALSSLGPKPTKWTLRCSLSPQGQATLCCSMDWACIRHRVRKGTTRAIQQKQNNPCVAMLPEGRKHTSACRQIPGKRLLYGLFEQRFSLNYYMPGSRLCALYLGLAFQVPANHPATAVA